MAISAHTTISITGWKVRYEIRQLSAETYRLVAFPFPYVQTRWWLNMKHKINNWENTGKWEVNHYNKTSSSCERSQTSGDGYVSLDYRGSRRGYNSRGEERAHRFDWKRMQKNWYAITNRASEASKETLI